MPLLDELSAVLGPEGLLTDPDVMAAHLTDWRGVWSGAALAVARPADTEQVAAVVRACAAAAVPLVPQGGNTGLVGGSVPDGTGRAVVLSLTRMRRVRELDPVDLTVVVEAGAVLADVQAAAADAGCLFPVSLASEGSCTVGGIVSTNAGGTGVLRWGMTRARVLGLEVVLPDGRVWAGLRPLRKDNTGYDLKQLFIGAEGTLGVVTAAVLALAPALRRRTVAWVGVPSVTAAVELLGTLRADCGERLSALELVGRPALDLVLAHTPGTRDPFAEPHPWYVLVELGDTDPDADLDRLLETALGRATEDGSLSDAVVADGPRARDLWLLREAISEAQQHEGPSHKHDVAVAVGRLPEFAARCSEAVEAVLPGTRQVVYGHVGDGNLHWNLSAPVGGDHDDFRARADELAQAVHGVAVGLGGTISAEHGIGRAKRAALTAVAPDVELDLMRTVKAALDPAGLMNPGVIL